MGLNIGLDFGTSNSGVAICNGQKVHLLPIDRQNILPEVVKTILYITRDDKAYIGQEAVELYYRHNVNRMRHFVKKWAGEIDYHGSDGMFYVRDVYVYEDELKPGRLLQYLKTALRKSGGRGDYQGTQIFERYYSVVDLVQTYLGALKARAEQILGGPIYGVTLGRPVKFSDVPELDRQAQDALRLAAYGAGFGQVEFEFEPVAAALAYEQTLENPQNVLIFDFGGGTLDIAIMRLGDRRDRRVYASGGIGIAGSDFDRTIIQTRMLPHFGLGRIGHEPDILELIRAVPDWIALPELSTPLVRRKLEQAIQKGNAPARLKTLRALIFNDLAFSFYNRVEAAKIALSSQGAAVIELQDQNINLWELYTRFQFEKDILEYQQQIENVVLETVAASGLEPEQIDAVVKTGGSSSIPAFSAMLESLFGRERVKKTNAFSSVAAGLAIRAQEMQMG
ncbi:MAG: Hsp70 family protein [Chloroflexota bacterium]